MTMKTFFTVTGLLVLVLIISAGCDYLSTDANDGTHDPGGPPGLGEAGITAVVPSPREELKAAIREYGQTAMRLLESEAGACVARPPTTRATAEDMNDRLNELLGQLGDGINIGNFFDQTATFGSLNFSQVDSVALNELAKKYTAIKEKQHGQCSASKEIYNQALALFQEHAEAIESMGLDGYRQLVQEVFADDNAQGWCEARCQIRHYSTTAGLLAGYSLAAAGCTAGTLGVGVVACGVLSGVVVASGIINSALDLQDCLSACDED